MATENKLTTAATVNGFAARPQTTSTLLSVDGLTLVAHQQPCQRQSDVESVLAVVVDGVHAVESGDLSREQPLEMLEGPAQRFHGRIRPGRPVKRLDGT